MARPAKPELRGQLLAAARELLVEEGAATFSLRQLSARVGYTLTVVYRFFDNRADLIAALQAELFTDLNRYCTDGLSGDSYARIKTMGRRFLQWAQDNEACFVLLFAHPEAGRSLRDNRLDRARAGYMLTVALMRMGVLNGELDIEIPEAAAVYLVSSLVGLASMSLSGRWHTTPGEDLLAFYDAHADRLLTPLLMPKK